MWFVIVWHCYTKEHCTWLNTWLVIKITKSDKQINKYKYLLLNSYFLKKSCWLTREELILKSWSLVHLLMGKQKVKGVVLLGFFFPRYDELECQVLSVRHLNSGTLLQCYPAPHWQNLHLEYWRGLKWNIDKQPLT